MCALVFVPLCACVYVCDLQVGIRQAEVCRVPSSRWVSTSTSLVLPSPCLQVINIDFLSLSWLSIPPSSSLYYIDWFIYFTVFTFISIPFFHNFCFIFIVLIVLYLVYNISVYRTFYLLCYNFSVLSLFSVSFNSTYIRFCVTFCLYIIVVRFSSWFVSHSYSSSYIIHPILHLQYSRNSIISLDGFFFRSLSCFFPHLTYCFLFLRFN